MSWSRCKDHWCWWGYTELDGDTGADTGADATELDDLDGDAADVVEWFYYM